MKFDQHKIAERYHKRAQRHMDKAEIIRLLAMCLGVAGFLLLGLAITLLWHKILIWGISALLVGLAFICFGGFTIIRAYKHYKTAEIEENTADLYEHEAKTNPTFTVGAGTDHTEF